MVWLLTAFQLGSFVCQWPLGRLSDRIDRRLVIAGCAAAVAVLSLVTAWTPAGPALLPLYFLLGGSTLTFYAVAVAHAADFAEPDQMVGVSSSLLLAWAAGAAMGPTIAAPFIDLLGPRGLFLYSFIVAAGLAGFVLWRMTRRASPLAKEGFVDLPRPPHALPTSIRACRSGQELDGPIGLRHAGPPQQSREARPMMHVTDRRSWAIPGSRCR